MLDSILDYGNNGLIGQISNLVVSFLRLNQKYKDISFINMQICKYGKEHLQDVLHTVYMLNIDALLPEILISLGECFKYNISQNKFNFLKIIQEMKPVVDKIILKAFLEHSDEIKKDDKMINSFEDILLTLVDVKSEMAAVILDEFRIH